MEDIFIVEKPLKKEEVRRIKSISQVLDLYEFRLSKGTYCIEIEEADQFSINQVMEEIRKIRSDIYLQPRIPSSLEEVAQEY